MGLMDDAKRAAKRSAELAEMSDAQRADRLRAELAASDTIGNNLQGEIKILVGKLGVACAEIETLRKRVAELEENVAHLCGKVVEKIAHAEQAEKRVAELERPLENAGVYGNAGRYWEGRYRDEAARAEQAEAQLARLDQVYSQRGMEAWTAEKINRLHARAEQAEAQLTCCQNDKATLKALTEQAEAARQEMESLALRAAVENQKTIDTLRARAKRAEAELKAMRALLVRLDRKGGLGLDVHDAIRAALSIPCRAGGVDGR